MGNNKKGKGLNVYKVTLRTNRYETPPSSLSIFEQICFCHEIIQFPVNKMLHFSDSFKNGLFEKSRWFGTLFGECTFPSHKQIQICLGVDRSLRMCIHVDIECTVTRLRYLHIYMSGIYLSQQWVQCWDAAIRVGSACLASLLCPHQQSGILGQYCPTLVPFIFILL